jgi:fused signal recognition particle receptor
MIDTIKKLKQSLSRTRTAVLGKIGQIITGRNIDDDLLDEIEEILLQADVGVSAAEKIIDRLRVVSREKKISDSGEIIDLLKNEMISILENNCPVEVKNKAGKPSVWLISGVNGTGKTTTVGKLAHYFKNLDLEVMIAACDTFRAAAVEQLAIWAERSNVQFIRAGSGADPASVAFDAANSAKARGTDILLIDTAGRLHTKANLMKELEKIRRVVEKVIPAKQVFSKLIIDGTTGQNAISQIKVFIDAIGCDGLIVTKLDGTAKGGVMVAIAEELGVPVDYIGLGESKEDLEAFGARRYVEALLNG